MSDATRGSIISASNASTIAFILPGLCKWQLENRIDAALTPGKMFAAGLVIYGSALLFVGSALAIVAAAEGDGEPACAGT